MAKIYKTTASELTSIADKIRAKAGTSSPISYPTGFTEGVTNLTDWNEVYAIISKTTTGYTQYDYSKIGNGTFAMCRSLSSVYDTKCTEIGDYAFSNCTSLTTVTFTSCSTIGAYAFINCSALTTAIFPVCTTIKSNAFYGLPNLTSISFPMCETIEKWAFRLCSISTISFPNCRTIADEAFSQCGSLRTAYFMGSSYVTLLGNAFANAGVSSIYVPASMVDTYKTMTYWTVLSNKLIGI